MRGFGESSNFLYNKAMFDDDFSVDILDVVILEVEIVELCLPFFKFQCQK